MSLERSIKKFEPHQKLEIWLGSQCSFRNPNHFAEIQPVHSINPLHASARIIKRLGKEYLPYYEFIKTEINNQNEQKKLLQEVEQLALKDTSVHHNHL